MIRYLQLMGSSVEVLETFKYGGVQREFNVRLRRGTWPSNADLIELLRSEASLPANLVGSVSPMAGDKTVQFNPAPEDRGEGKAGKNVSSIQSDGRGSMSRVDAGLPAEFTADSPAPRRGAGRHGNDRRPDGKPQPRGGSHDGAGRDGVGAQQ